MIFSPSSVRFAVGTFSSRIAWTAWWTSAFFRIDAVVTVDLKTTPYQSPGAGEALAEAKTIAAPALASASSLPWIVNSTLAPSRPPEPFASVAGLTVTPGWMVSVTPALTATSFFSR